MATRSPSVVSTRSCRRVPALPVTNVPRPRCGDSRPSFGEQRDRLAHRHARHVELAPSAARSRAARCREANVPCRRAGGTGPRAARSGGSASNQRCDGRGAGHVRLASNILYIVRLGCLGQTSLTRPIRGNVRRAPSILAPWLVLLAAWYARSLQRADQSGPGADAARRVRALHRADAQRRLPLDILMSTRRVFVGVLCGIALAVPVGFVLGWYRTVRTFIDPLINFFRALPPIALIPLVIVYFGVDEIAKTVILFYASFFAGVIVMYEGISQISPIYVRVARTLGATDGEIFRKVVDPAGRAAHADGVARRARCRLGDACRLRADRRPAGARRADPERRLVLPARHHLCRHHLHRLHRAADGPRAARVWHAASSAGRSESL